MRAVLLPLQGGGVGHLRRLLGRINFIAACSWLRVSVHIDFPCRVSAIMEMLPSFT